MLNDPRIWGTHLRRCEGVMVLWYRQMHRPATLWALPSCPPAQTLQQADVPALPRRHACLPCFRREFAIDIVRDNKAN